MKLTFQNIFLRGKPSSVIAVGTLLIVTFWLFDAMVDYHFFSRDNLLEQLFNNNGEEFWFRITVTVFLAGFTWYAWVVVRHRDLLEAQLEQALLQSQDEQAKSTAIIAAIADGISIHDLEFRILHQNAVHQEMFGGDHRGKFCYEAYYCNDEVCPVCPLADAMADGQVHRVERPARPDSGVDFIEVTASPIRNAKGEIIGGLDIVRDISARKWGEDALRQQALFFQRLIDTIPSPVFYKNCQGIFLGCNDAFQKCMGRPKDEVVGRTLFELMPYEIAAMYGEKDDELFANPGTQIYESYVLCTATGAQREVIFYKATYSDQHGDIAGLVGVVIDIAERVAAEKAVMTLNSELSRQAAELAAANRELEAYNYSFTHDLRKYLTRISSSSQILNEEYRPQIDESGRNLLQGILDAVEQIQSLSEGMQVLFSVTRREIRHETVNLSELASSVATDLRLTDPDREAIITVQQDLHVLADPRLMQVLLENLLGNAWKYTGRQAESIIEVGAERAGDELCCYVRDNGAGFPTNKAAQLFNPFVRLHRADEFPGSGIGLATVQRIVQRHGGRIWAEGEPDLGATIWFTLPAADAHSERGDR
jgi:PAS domain S-box-containing protein